jgi:hypothetical protein
VEKLIAFGKPDGYAIEDRRSWRLRGEKMVWREAANEGYSPDSSHGAFPELRSSSFIIVEQ